MDASTWCHARGNWTAEEWNQVVFSDESRCNLSSDDNRVRVWRPLGERLNPAFALQQHTATTAGIENPPLASLSPSYTFRKSTGRKIAPWSGHPSLEAVQVHQGRDGIRTSLLRGALTD
ncbi:transposable element Tcb1 transposase [Trichonephila clavipes]|nr:transposable element Tcb1 transposase [Trichonephila clavipes]